ncbi:MAG TPA: hypothetical protein VFT72_06550 [Opitutaceae bacterium]|nr:hypothetical protein [Opitutaceae bacterium]
MKTRLPRPSLFAAIVLGSALSTFSIPTSASTATAAASPSAVGAQEVTPTPKQDPSAEVDAAIAKLDGATYRKRDQMFGMAAVGSAGMAMVTEVSGNRSRLVMEMDLPQMGKMTQEQVKIGDRTAIRVSAPGLVAKIDAAKRDLTMSSAKNLFRQITQIAMAMQTGGLSTAQLVMQAVQAAATAKSTAEAHAALNRVSKAFNSWTVMKPDSEADAETAEAMAAAGYPAPMAGASASSMMKVEKKLSTDGKTAQFTRRPTMAMPAGSDFYSIVYVDTATGLPTAEENFINGQRLMRTDYMDFGAPITIDIPDCLK